MKKILVTGGMGYIGSHTTVELITAGYEVIIVDNLSNSRSETIHSIQKITGVKPLFYELDLCNKNEVADLFHTNQIDAVIHFAAFKAVGESVQHPLHYYNNNLVSLINLLGEIRNSKLETRNLKLVFSSSCSVYGDTTALPVTEEAVLPKPESPYGNTKQISEEILSDCCKVNKNMNVISLRYFNPAGAHASALIGEYPLEAPDNLVPVITQTAMGIRKELIVHGNDYDTPDGTCIRDFIHVVDVAKAHVVAVNRLLNREEKGDKVIKENSVIKEIKDDPNYLNYPITSIPNYEVFNLGTGKGSSVLEAIKAFEKVTGVKLNYRIGPRREGDVVKVYADTTKANKELGWKAVHTLEDIMRSAWVWESRMSTGDKMELKIKNG